MTAMQDHSATHRPTANPSFLRRVLSWNGSLPDWLVGTWLPLIVFLGSYAATTVFGAVYFLLPAGKIDLANFLGVLNSNVAADIGSATYLSLLFLPFVVAPIFAFAGMRLTAFLARRIGVPRHVAYNRISRTALFTLAAFSAGYCIYTLYASDALFPELLLDPNSSYQQKIIQRTLIFDSFGRLFFIIAYGFIPMLSVIFFIRFEKCGRSRSDIIGFLITFFLFYFIIFHLYSKSHILVFSLMLISSVLISRSSIWYVVGLAFVSILSFVIMEALMSGMLYATIHSATPPSETVTTELPAEKNPQGAVPSATLPGQQQVTREVAVTYLGNYISKGVFLRMASSFPFYVSIFEAPSARCGVEAHLLRKVLFLPPSDCTLPTKVFAVMYPDVKWVTGYSPSPAHVSAYGELGIFWAVAVMALSGLTLGCLGSVMQLGTGPLFVGIGVASCTFAYYLSQLPFVAAFTYGHGLIFLLLPVIVLFGVSWLRDYAFPTSPT